MTIVCLNNNGISSVGRALEVAKQEGLHVAQMTTQNGGVVSSRGHKSSVHNYSSFMLSALTLKLSTFLVILLFIYLFI